MSMSSGAYSRNNFMQSMKIGTVVIRTRTVKTNAVIGSAIFQVGWQYIIIAAIRTPAAWMPSAIRWTIAALTFVFSLFFLLVSYSAVMSVSDAGGSGSFSLKAYLRTKRFPMLKARPMQAVINIISPSISNDSKSMMRHTAS